jgi:hypothetical protein
MSVYMSLRIYIYIHIYVYIYVYNVDIYVYICNVDIGSMNYSWTVVGAVVIVGTNELFDYYYWQLFIYLLWSHWLWLACTYAFLAGLYFTYGA